MGEPARIIVDGDVTPLRQKLREAGDDLKRFGAEGESAFSRMTGPLAALQSKFVAIGALLAGGAVFKQAVTQAAVATEESVKFGRALGISATQAGVLREALAAGNTSQEEFLGAAKGLTKQLRENESGLQAMGLKTRDAAGNLRPLNELTLEAIGVMNGYRAGTDRAIAGQALFGKGFEATSNLAEMNKEAVAEVAEQMRALGILTTEESVAAWKAFDDAGDKAGLTLKGVQLTIGNALLPILTDLGNWFAAIGPAAVTVIRGAFGGLVATFHLVTTGVTVLWETLNAMVVSVAEPVRALGEAIGKALTGDWDGAVAAVKGIGPNISAAWGKAFDEMATKAQSTRDRISTLFGEGTAAAAPGTGGKGAGDLVKKGDKPKHAKEAADPSFMGTYEARLAEIKNAYEQENALRQFNKEQELAYWRELQASYDLTSKDRVGIAKRTATLELEIRRESAKQGIALTEAEIEAQKNAALAQLELDRQAAQFAEASGASTKAALLAQEEQFAARRYEIELQATLQRGELARLSGDDPVAMAKLNEEKLKALQAYQAARAGLQQQAMAEEDKQVRSTTDDVGNAVGSMATNMLTRVTNLRQQLVQVFQSIYQSFVANMVSKPLAEWIAAQTRMLLMKMGFIAQEKTLETTAAATSVGIKTAETTAVVSENAVQAATGAASSQASIPWVGPILALAAMAAMFAAVTGMRRKSAAGGFDIPKGLNPMTQLHEEEMVLPKVHANTIRRLGELGEQGGAAAAPAAQISITAMDSRDVLRALKEGGTLHKALRDLNRSFAR